MTGFLPDPTDTDPGPPVAIPPLEPPGATPETVTLDFELPAADLPRLLRASALSTRRAGRARTTPASIVWHDTADGALAAGSLTLSRSGPAGRAAWRLERLLPNGHMDWLPAGRAPLVAEAASLDNLGEPVPAKLAPVAAFNGCLRAYALRGQDGAEQLRVLEGTLRGVSQDRPACRVMLTGQPSAVADLACALAEAAPLRVPRAGLAAQAIAVARGNDPAPRHLGGPAIPAGLSLDEALTFVTAHLADVILHWAALIPGAGTPEPVHQMRVGVRRLRSALSVFRRATRDDTGGDTTGKAGQAGWLDQLSDELKAIAAQLGTARDWDVFLAETGADVSQAFAQDRRIAGLLAAAARQRDTAYAGLVAHLRSQGWTRLEMTLALLPTRRPWLQSGTGSSTVGPVEPYAAHALQRRLKQVLAPGPSLTHLPAHELHHTRKQAKRLRYAAELFAGLFPDKAVRKYLRRLEHLQEVLGAVNDSAVAASLVGQLGGGADRAFAAGAVQGFGAARSAGASARADRAWRKFTRAEPFWQ